MSQKEKMNIGCDVFVLSSIRFIAFAFVSAYDGLLALFKPEGHKHVKGLDWLTSTGYRKIDHVIVNSLLDNNAQRTPCELISEV